MVETEKLPEGQRAWPISPFKRYSRVRRRLSQQPCTSRMVVSLGLSLLACALGSAAGEWQSVDGYRFKALTVSTNEPVGFTSLSPDSTGLARAIGHRTAWYNCSLSGIQKPSFTFAGLTPVSLQFLFRPGQKAS